MLPTSFVENPHHGNDAVIAKTSILSLDEHLLMKERNMYLHVPNKMVCKTSTGVDLHVHACISKGVTVLNTLNKS